jgi:tetratricopeptide (TPR) repeat protein
MAQICPQCGAEILSGALQGQCPKCMARIVFGGSQDLGVKPEASTETNQKTQEEPIETGDLTGRRIGRYKLLEKIGEGGFGIVYMAEQIEPVQRKVAFKIIKPGMDSRAIIARFEAERQALALMDHPNIARVLDAGTTEAGHPYFVMELVKGISITDYCDQSHLPTTDRLRLFIKVCHAVQHAHQKGIIHRDIKPSNVLVTLFDGEPVPKVIDFGIAKALGQKLTSKTLFTGFAQMMGTLAYMSPEQAELSGLDIDTRSDIYSLGGLLYELLTGVTPFDSETFSNAALDKIRSMIRETEPPKPSTRLRTLGAKLSDIAKHRRTEPSSLHRLLRGDLDWIVMKCLEKDRQRRYDTANALAGDLEHHLKHEPVTAAAPSAVYKTVKLVARHKAAFASAAALLLLLVAGVVVSSWQAVRARRAEKHALTEAIKSQHVSQFLQQMLRGVRPSVALGRDTVLLGEILSNTVERVGKELKNEPEVEAELRNTIGEVYWALDQGAEAERMHQQALALRRGLYGNVNLEVAQSLHDLTAALWNQGKFPQAEAAEREALAIRQELLGPEHALVADSLNDLGTVLRERAKHAEAESLLRQAMEMRRKLLGNESLELAESIMGLSSELFSVGRLEEAERLDREALPIYEKVQGEESPDIATLLSDLADVLQNAGKFEESDGMGRKALAMRQKLLPPDHLLIGVSLNNIALGLHLQGKLPEAEDLYRHCLSSFSRRFGTNDLRVATLLNNLGAVLRDEGRLAEGEDLIRQALAIRRNLLKDDENLPVAGSLYHLGLALHRKGELTEAEALHRRALTIRRKLLSEPAKFVAASLDALGAVLRDQGRLEESESMHRSALVMRKKLLGDLHPEVMTSLTNLALVLQKRGDLAGVETVSREILGIERKRWTNNPAQLEPVLENLAEVLCRLQKFDQAESLLLGAYTDLQQAQPTAPAQIKPLLRSCCQKLADLYKLWQKLDKSARWLAEAGKYRQS